MRKFNVHEKWNQKSNLISIYLENSDMNILNYDPKTHQLNFDRIWNILLLYFIKLQSMIVQFFIFVAFNIIQSFSLILSLMVYPIKFLKTKQLFGF